MSLIFREAIIPYGGKDSPLTFTEGDENLRWLESSSVASMSFDPATGYLTLFRPSSAGPYGNTSWSPISTSIDVTGFAKAIIASTAPDTASLATGSLYWDTDDGNLYMLYSYVSASISGTAWVPATSLVLQASSASYTETASYVTPLVQDVYITGSLNVLGDITATNLHVINITSSNEYLTGSTIFGDDVDVDTHQFTGSVNITGSLLVNGVPLPDTASYAVTASYVDITGSGIIVNYSASQIQLTASAVSFSFQDVTTIGNVSTASIVATGSFTGSFLGESYTTGSLFGTASWAESSSYTISSSYAATASYYIMENWTINEFVDDTAAAAGGVPLGGIYRSGNIVVVRIV